MKRARLVTAAALVTLGLAGSTVAAVAASPSQGVDRQHLTRTTHLDVAAATEAARAALRAAEKENQRVSVAVVDRNGNTIVTLRGDGAGPQSYESAERKAFTAVSWNAPTSELAARL